MKSYIYW